MRNKSFHSATITAFFILTAGAMAAHPWMSARTVHGQTRPLGAGTEEIIGPDGRMMRLQAGAVSNALFDIVISLHSNPDGGSKHQERYEQIIGYFADAVYEQSGGAHALRKVSIYRRHAVQNPDVLWEFDGHPCAMPLKQGGPPEWGIIDMFDVFGFECFHTDANGLENAGYVLGHEWAHYAYGLFDEYCSIQLPPDGPSWSPLAESEMTIPCLMNNHREAIGRNYIWLNHSVSYGKAHWMGVVWPYRCGRKTAQWLLHGDGAWQVMASDPAYDPLNDDYHQYRNETYGTRLYFPELATVAPDADSMPEVTLCSDTPLDELPSREHLDIRWMDNKALVVIVIENSSRIEDYRVFSQALKGAYNIVRKMDRDSHVAVITHNSRQQEVLIFGPEKIGNNRDEIRYKIYNKIPRIWNSGSYFYGGLRMASSVIRNFDGQYPNCMRIIVVFSDYFDDGDTYAGAWTRWFQDRQVPIVYGQMSSAYHDDTAMLAEETGGTYVRRSQGWHNRVRKRLAEVMAELQGNQNLVSGAQTFKTPQGSTRRATAPVNIPFRVDARLINLIASVEYDATSTAELRLRAPGGEWYDPDETDADTNSVTLFFDVNSPATGEWAIAGTISDGGDLAYHVQATPAGEEFPFYLTAAPENGAAIEYPDPIRFQAVLRRGTRDIKGATVYALITDPQTNTVTLAMENIMGGRYGSQYMPDRNGDYLVEVMVDNDAGTAAYTWEHKLMARRPNGVSASIPTDEPVDEKFERTASFEINVSGMENAIPPASPTGVTATDGECPDFVRILWNNVADASAYEVWRARSGSTPDFARIASLDRERTSYIDSAVTTGRSYDYRVRAVNAIGASALSAKATGWPLFGPAIRVNNQRALTLAGGEGEGVNVVVILRLGQYQGIEADCWVAAYAEDIGAWFYLDAGMQWQPAADIADFRPVYTGPIGDLDAYTVLHHPALPRGTYWFYFGVDINPDGILDMEPGLFYYDTAVIRVE